MRTKNEIFDLIMGYLDMAITMGFYTKEEIKEIENLEKEYWVQSDNQELGSGRKIILPRRPGAAGCELFVNF